MKIAMVFDMMLWGGIERVGVSYIKLFQNLGHHVDVYILNPKTKSIVNEISEICNAKILNFRKRACPDNWWSIVEYKNFHGFELFVFLIMYFGLSAFNKITKRKYSIKIKYDFFIAYYDFLLFAPFLYSLVPSPTFLKTDVRGIGVRGTKARLPWPPTRPATRIRGQAKRQALV